MKNRVPTVSLTQNGPSLSRLVYGCWRLHEDPEGATSDRILRKIEHCLELGIHSFDHADIYGDYENEERFGNSLKLKPSLKDSITIVTKCGIQAPVNSRPEVKTKYYDTSETYIINSVERSLKKLNVDKIDLLLIHRPDPLSDPNEVANAFNKLKQEGKVQHFGVSNFSTSQFRLLQSRLDFSLSTNQIELHPLHLSPFLDGTVDQAQEYRFRPMTWSPTAGGRIFNPKEKNQILLLQTLNTIASDKNKKPDQILYAWLLKHPAGFLPILGTNDKQRIEDAANSLDIELSKQEWFQIWEAGSGRPVP